MDDDLPTPRSISRTGYRVHVWCKACRHAKDADLVALVDAGRGDVPLIHLRFRCSNCGSVLTDSVVTSKDDPRFLRDEASAVIAILCRPAPE
jgi:hypothetical protein